MKKHQIQSVLVILFLSFIVIPVEAQYGIYNLNIIPTNPTVNDTIKLISHKNFGSSPCIWVNSSVQINGSVITVYDSVLVGPATQPCQSKDTFLIGKLNAGTYQLICHLIVTTGLAPSDTDTITFTVQQPTGLIDETKSLEGIFVYPNPVADILTIEVKKKAQLTIYDALGRRVFARALAAGKNTLPFNQFSSGIYTLKITSEETVFYGKIVKE